MTRRALIKQMIGAAVSFGSNPGRVAAEPGVGAFHGRVLSWRVLQQRAQAEQRRGLWTPEVRHLGFLTRIRGYVIDEPHRDVLLLGDVQTGWPRQHLEDWVVAARSAWDRYARRRGNTIYVEHPGVSIDARSAVLLQLRRAAALVHNARIGHVKDATREWRRACEQPQDTRVLGIPFRSRAAKVMLDADFLTKRFVDTEAPDIPGFTSLLDLHLDEARAALRTGRASARGSMNRFFYYPEELEVAADDGAGMIQRFGLTLLTQEQHVSRQGHATDSGSVDPMAEKWARLFMAPAVWSTVCERYPVFREMESFAWMTAMTRTMRYQNAASRAGLDLEWSLDSFQVPEVDVPATYPGRCNVKWFEQTDTVPGGSRRSVLVMPSCGGVDLAVRVDARSLRPDGGRFVRRAREAAVRARPDASTLYWDV